MARTTRAEALRLARKPRYVPAIEQADDSAVERERAHCARRDRKGAR